MAKKTEVDHYEELSAAGRAKYDADRLKEIEKTGSFKVAYDNLYNKRIYDKL